MGGGAVGLHHLITMICDPFCRQSNLSKASSLLDEGDVEEEEDSDLGSQSGVEEEGDDSDGWGEDEEEEEDWKLKFGTFLGI